MPFALRLTRDALAPQARYPRPLRALNRVLYILAGELAVRGGGGETHLRGDQGWYSAGAVEATAGAGGATVLRYELVPPQGASPAPDAPPAFAARVLLEHAIDLDPSRAYLIRCDRVDFEPGGEALPHRHKGGGIRCLLEGSLQLRIEGHAERTIQPGEAWFESGREPVHAGADPRAATSFIRCSILPREIRGQSSIMYVNPADAARGRPRRYTVLVDEGI